MTYDLPAKTGVTMNPDISVAIPMHNEEEGVEALTKQLQTVLESTGRSYEVIIVDDGSTDQTWEKLVAMATHDAHWRAFRLRKNFGQTPAMRCGIEQARGRYIVTMDGDLQNDSADIPRLIAKLEEGYDVVCGWRYRRQDKLWTRKIPSTVANHLISLLTGVRLHDYGCSLKIYRADAIKRTPLYAEFHRFIPALSTLTGALITELQVDHHPRRFGRTKYNLNRTWRVALDMLTVSLLVKFSSRPLRFFGGLALCSFIMAIVCVVHAWGWYAEPYFTMPQVLPGVAVLGIWLAGHLLLVGLSAELCLATAHGRPEGLIAPEQG